MAVDRTRHIGDALVEYIPDRSHRHEGAHSITVAGQKVVVRPDGQTTGRNRSDVITRVLNALSQPDTASQVAVAALVGALVLAGATSIEVDGSPILDGKAGQIAVLRLEVASDGTISVASMGGSG